MRSRRAIQQAYTRGGRRDALPTSVTPVLKKVQQPPEVREWGLQFIREHPDYVCHEIQIAVKRHFDLPIVTTATIRGWQAKVRKEES